MTFAPSVSIGLPVHNGERFLIQTIDSVLAQSFGDLELIICDNGSTDGTQSIAEAYAAKDSRVRYYRNDQYAGAGYCYNRAFEVARGEYFKWIAAGDLMAPDFVEKCVEALDATPAAVLAYTNAGRIDASGQSVGELRHEATLDEQASTVARFKLFRQHAPEWPALYFFSMVRAGQLRRVKQLGTYAGAEEAMLYELLFLGQWVQVPEVLLFFRGLALPQLHDTGRKGFSAVLGVVRRHFEYLVAIGDAPTGRFQRVGLAWHHFKWLLSSRPKGPENVVPFDRRS